MNTVFEDIYSKMEQEIEAKQKEQIDSGDTTFLMLTSYINAFHVAKQFVQEVEEKYNNGHFGCNSNGEHEKCNDCPLTNCNIRNKIWFGYEKLTDNKKSVSHSLDMVSREDVGYMLDTIEMSADETWMDYYRKALNGLSELPSGDSWIPCSSGKFPNKYVAVDVTIKQETDDGGYEYLVKESWYQEGDSWNMQKNRHNPVVIAWKPKAKPYEEAK